MTTLRQKRLSELLRHEIASVLLRDDFHDPMLDNRAVIVSQVDVSPDLSHAKIFVETLAGKDSDLAVKALNKLSGRIRHQIKPHLHIKRMPKLHFILDDSFQKADHLNRLINNISR